VVAHVLRDLCRRNSTWTPLSEWVGIRATVVVCIQVSHLMLLVPMVLHHMDLVFQ